VHADDVADAYVRGAFNLAADPVLDGPALAQRYQGRVVPVPVPILRAAATASWRARLQLATPTSATPTLLGPHRDHSKGPFGVPGCGETALPLTHL
jgi:hypothetical protein